MKLTELIPHLYDQIQIIQWGVKQEMYLLRKYPPRSSHISEDMLEEMHEKIIACLELEWEILKLIGFLNTESLDSRRTAPTIEEQKSNSFGELTE